MEAQLPASWTNVVGAELRKPYFKQLQAFVAKQRAQFPDDILPPADEVFAAFAATPYAKVRVVLLGQDPYPGKGLAHGLCFSVRRGTKIPGSLRNMFKMLHDQHACRIPNNGFLLPWARQGVLMLNTVLTVRAGAAGSHAGKGWETFTDAVIQALVARTRPVVFVMLGRAAQKKRALITQPRHAIVEAAHPSPLSARAFFKGRPFADINAALAFQGQPPIDWQIPDIAD